MANLNASASLTLQVTDVATSVVLFTRQVPGLANTGITTEINSYYAVAPTLNVDYELPLPNIGTVVGAYILNKGSAGQILTVKMTPSGGVKAILMALQPGGCFLFFEPTVGGGITEIAVNPSANAIPFEYLLIG